MVVGLGYNTITAVSVLTFPVFAQGIATTIKRTKVRGSAAFPPQSQENGLSRMDTRTQVLNVNDPTDPLLIAETAHRTTIDTAAVFVPLILLVDARTAGLANGSVLKTAATVAVVGAVLSRTLLYKYFLTTKSLLEPSLVRTFGTWGSYIFGGVLSLLPLF
ncbi:hypothetical protein DFJ77DRAFT_543273 [Powellomyces hirtus]|nr:hypothetical protein DFJ77DRAFT_543273 [Powellomyces hirtus]